MSELVISHNSVHNWQEPGMWEAYLKEAQRLIGSPLTRLDDNDPVRRKVVSLEDTAEFICAFGSREDSRWIFGEFGKTGITFSIWYFRQPGQNHRYNTLTWSLPLSFLEGHENIGRIKNLFDLGNRSLKPFYAYSDDLTTLQTKKQKYGNGLEAELTGIFWLTYLHAAYVAFFGKDTFDNLPGVEFGNDGDVTIVLGESPMSVSSELRQQMVDLLGRESFVNPSDILGKLPGRFALTFQQINSF